MWYVKSVVPCGIGEPSFPPVVRVPRACVTCARAQIVSCECCVCACWLMYAVYVYVSCTCMCVCVSGLAVRARASVPVGILQGVRVLSDFGLAGQPRQLRMMRPPLCY